MTAPPAISSSVRRWRWLAVVLMTVVLVLTGLVLWFGEVFADRSDRLFRGKPESEWIKNLKYNDSQQVQEWRAYGEEGVQVLIRGLERARRTGRAYRKFNQHLPAFLRQVLPAPKPDSTVSARVQIASLLWSLGNDARSATEVMIWTVNKDESLGVRQIVIGYFNYNGAENCPLNQLSAEQKREVLPAYLRAIQDPRNQGLRHNASIGLKYFPEQRDIVAPILVKALQDSEPHVPIYAAEALNRIAPEVAKEAGAMAILVAAAKGTNAGPAAKAVDALGHSGSLPQLAVPVLIECMQGTNTTIACEAIWSLEWAPKEFDAYSDTVIPALTATTERKDSVGGYARAALARWKSKPGVQERK